MLLWSVCIFACLYIFVQKCDDMTDGVHDTDGPKPSECSCRHCGAGDPGEHETLCLHVHEHIASMIPDMSVPNRKDRYKCGWLGCYFSSKSKNDITIHVRRIHIHERLQRCPKCPYECVPVSELIKHMRVKHGHHSS